MIIVFIVLYSCYCRVADLVLHGVFSLVCKGLHYDQGQVEILRRVSTDCDKVQCVCVCVCVYVCVCVCMVDLLVCVTIQSCNVIIVIHVL